MSRIFTPIVVLAMFAMLQTQAQKTVSQWKANYDAQYASGKGSSSQSHARSLSNSGFYDQQQYFLSYYIHGAVKMWQATGDIKYFNEARLLIDNSIATTVTLSNGRKGWPGRGSNVGYALWDSFWAREVTYLLRVLDESPDFRQNTSGVQNWFNSTLSWVQENIWNRYYQAGLGHIERVNAHMASHWARIGLHLWKITGQTAQYKEVYENFCYKGMSTQGGASFRGNLRLNPNNNSAYVWNTDWNNSYIQDTSHGNVVIQTVVDGFKENEYWNQTDINRFLSTLKNVVWRSEDVQKNREFVDGSGGYFLQGRMHAWLTLGQYDASVQNRIESNYFKVGISYDNSAYYGNEAYGIAAYNAAVLYENGPKFPEADVDDKPDPPIDDEACDNGLDNEDASVDLNGGVLATGLDAAQTTTDANGSPCAIRLVNNDGGQPWAKYQITVDLAANDISPGDELEFSIDGNGSGGRARIEVVENARPNTWEIGHNFGNGWSTHTQRVTVPSGIATLDIWIYSNFNSSSAGSARYDNLSVRKTGQGTGGDDDEPDPPIDDEACDNGLDNEDASVDLNGGVLATGLDAAQTTTDANGSPCAIRLVNNDGGQPWAKYQITVDLAANDISPGDELEFSIDGNGSGEGPVSRSSRTQGPTLGR
ncbi:hypothetical protein [Maribacter halichondriae]|uniref:hypothetical protein n=1 Tax=Maribacter halichondriae TaxID=2980554 RepID=UPI002358804B|nr:hypothetical protein [Maribacter sp. Hal144]